MKKNIMMASVLALGFIFFANTTSMATPAKPKKPKKQTSGVAASNLDKNALDPLHIISYIAKRFDQNSEPSFSPITSGHMFKYKAASATSNLEIKVTDRFGNVYTETMARPKTFDTDTYIR